MPETMRGLILRAFAILALMMVGVGGAARPAAGQVASSTAMRFDALIADAKARMLVDPARAITKARAAESVATTLTGRDRILSVAKARWLQGEGYLRLNDPAQAEPLIKGAIALVEKGGPPTKLNGDLLLSKGGLDSANAKVADALGDYQAAHNIFRDIGDTRMRSIALVSIAILYQNALDQNTSLKYFGQAMDVYKGDPQLLFSIYGNRGISFSDLHRPLEALAEFRHALDIARQLESPVLEARTLRNIARVQLDTGQLQAADRTIGEGFRVSRDDAAFARNQFLVLSAYSAKLHGNLPEAERLIGRAFVGIDPTQSTLEWRQGHETAYDVYRKAGNERQALVHLEALKRLDDQTSKLAASANTALAAARFDFANQELNIEKLKRAQLQRNIDDAKRWARTQQFIFIGLAVATLVIVSMLVFGLVTIRRSRNDVRAANIDLARTNVALGKALAAKTEFLATTSHEIRTPLNGILGMTQVMLADQRLDATLRDRIGVVHGAGVTMRALVDDILDVAKMETGNLTIERVPFDLKAALRDVSRMWEEQARGKGVAFVLDLDDCPAFIEGDAARLRQIAFNLLSNALKFTEHGTVTVRADATDALLRIAVSDTGIGIPADKLGIIFESFRQVDAGTTRKFGGTGLGLSICRNLARAMDGDVAVSSVVGEGSTFTVEMPLSLAAAPDIATPDAAAMPSALLILDRNPISRSMLRAVLTARAGNVVFAATVDEALSRIAGGGVSRVLIDDATIKAADDMDAALALLGGSAVPTVLLWPAPDDAERARFAAVGIDRVIAKPIAGAALAALVFAERGKGDSVPSQVVTQAA